MTPDYEIVPCRRCGHEIYTLWKTDDICSLCAPLEKKEKEKESYRNVKY